MIKDVLFDETLLDRFVKEVKEKYPKKAFGFFISDTEGGQPVDFIMFNDDVRNEWKDEFEKYGQYYVKLKYLMTRHIRFLTHLAIHSAWIIF